MRLPDLALNAWFPQADDVKVTVSVLPKGPYASPLVDVVYLSKLVSLLEPQAALELGSYRGHVALAIASHMPDDSRLVTVDIIPEHGEAYKGADVSRRIERRVGAIDDAMFAGEQGAYDLIFIDADHAYESVKHDTGVALPLLRPDGVMVWHDYANWGAFSKWNGVPEFLVELAEQLPVVHLAGTNMAVHRPAWARQERADLDGILATTQRWQADGAWESEVPPRV
ncbi:MAG TPA: class I SAM-dependent methyltransferase [Acidimicrobiales bacterium]|jgi:predicted O-methyltransferase YrrM|nr:class I SAM-dependent methyltransferase [Acidimicrobiales bacterium]